MQLQGNTSSSEFFMRNFQRRALQVIEKGKQWNEGITADEMSHQFNRIA